VKLTDQSVFVWSQVPDADEAKVAPGFDLVLSSMGGFLE
jgi:hypothetical protein